MNKILVMIGLVALGLAIGLFLGGATAPSAVPTVEESPSAEETNTKNDAAVPDVTPADVVNDARNDAEPVSTPLPTPALDMSDQGLTQVSKSIFDRVELVSLDLSHNKLTGALQAEVRHLQNLEVLNLSHNAFTGVPAEIGQLSKLRRLDLSYNQLTGLPYELGNLQNLEVLDLRGNNASEQDLAVIREKLPSTVEIIR